MKHAILCLTILCSLTASAITRSELAEYAKSLQGKKKSELKTAVHDLIGSPNTLYYGSGNGRTWWGFYYTDRNEATNECINRYSAKKFYFLYANNGFAISGMNIEHSFPKSWWGGSTNNAYKDLFNLYPSDSLANSSKSNFPMGIVENVKEESEGYDKVGTGTIDGVKGRNCWEPGNQYKGDFARAYMYMVTAYQNYTWQGEQGLQQLENNEWPTLKPWAYTLYLKWLKSDPVDKLEAARNNAVAKIQHNRNLFVDYPYLSEYIWGDSINVAFDPYTSITTATDDDRYTGTPVTDDDTPDDILSTDFAETFNQCSGSGGNDGVFSGSIASSSFEADNDGWEASTKYGGDSCARFGSSKVKGTVTTPEIMINGTSIFSFRAVPWGSDGNSLKLSVSGNGTLSQTELEMVTGQWTEYTVTLTGKGEVSITFTPAQRFFLDDVYVIAEKEEEPVPGDVDGDGVITTTDAIDLINIVLGKADEDDYEIDAADFDQNGVLDITDITKLIELLMKQKQ